MLSAFIKSTIDVRHSSFSFCAATALSKIGATSIVCAGADDVRGLVAEPPAAVVVPEPAASALVPKIALIIFPKMLICTSFLDFCFEDKNIANGWFRGGWNDNFARTASMSRQ